MSHSPAHRRELVARRRSLLALLSTFSMLAGLVATITPSHAVPAPETCDATVQEDGLRVSWTHPAEDLTEFHVREYGNAESRVDVPGDQRSVLWTDDLHRDPARFAVRALDADGWSTSACVTDWVSLSDPAPQSEGASETESDASAEPARSSQPSKRRVSATPEPTSEPSSESSGSSTDDSTTSSATAASDTTATSDDSTTTSGPAGSTLLPCTAGSFYKDRVGDAPVDDTLTSQFRSFMRSHPEQGGMGITWPKINVNEDWAMSYDISDASDPVWRLSGGNTDHEKLKHLTTSGFHMSDEVASTFPDGNQDRPGVIFDTENGFIVQFADAVANKATRTISVSNAAIMYSDSNCLDYRNPRSDDARNFTSRGRILPSMVIPREFLDQAVANGTGLGYVLHLYFVETDTAAGDVHPMVGHESGKSGWGAEGVRVRIAPGVDLAARGLSGACLAVARTLQENGAYVGDNSGSGTQIKASQPQHYVGTNLATDCMEGKVSWDDFEVVKPGSQ